MPTSSSTSERPAPRPGEPEWHPRLRPEDAAERRIRGAMGLLLAYPWFDRLSLWMLVRYFFPLSRLWAAATESHGLPDRFIGNIPLVSTSMDINRIQGALFQVEAARAAAAAVDATWEEDFFGAAGRSVEQLVAIETARRDHRHTLNTTRRLFRFLLKHPIPIISPQTPTPDEVAAVYDAALGNRTPFFAPPDPMPEVEVSRRVPGSVGTDYWIRFPSPSNRLGDTVYAHVHEPEGVSNPPTMIFGHGICVEFDHWHGLVDEVDGLCRMGFRVIRPEAPWHGRRRLPGQYSGETIVSRTPFGPLDAFCGALREWSVLIHWARQAGSGPVTIGGSSLGALMSLLCASIAKDWPQALRPQAMLLLTHAGRQQDALIRGALARVWKAREAMEARGWTSDLSERYMPILDPDWNAIPDMGTENIVSVLGRYDHVTPFDSGLDLLDAWGVPGENRFIWRRGHFSVPMTLIRNTGPLERFRSVVSRL
jgi:pimeloyl-ACP methyl ester carboxylesterase